MKIKVLIIVFIISIAELYADSKYKFTEANWRPIDLYMLNSRLEYLDYKKQNIDYQLFTSIPESTDMYNRTLSLYESGYDKRIYTKLGGVLSYIPFGILDSTNTWTGINYLEKTHINNTSSDYALSVTGYNVTDGIELNAQIMKIAFTDPNDGEQSGSIVYNNGLFEFNNSVTALQIESDGKVTISSWCYVNGDISAENVIDRTPYPKSVKEAYEAINSIEGSDGKVDHKKLHDSLKIEYYDKRYNPETKSTETYTAYGRNLSATVSALVEVIKEQDKRIQDLENRR